MNINFIIISEKVFYLKIIHCRIIFMMNILNRFGII